MNPVEYGGSRSSRSGVHGGGGMVLVDRKRSPERCNDCDWMRLEAGDWNHLDWKGLVRG